MASTSGQQFMPPTTAASSSKPSTNRGRSKGSTALERYVASYIVSLKRIGIFFPTIAFIMTLVFFFYDSLVTPFLWINSSEGFLILIAGLLSALIIVLIYAFCNAPFVISANKGLQDYALLEIIERKLQGYFDIPETGHGTSAIVPIDISDLKQDPTKLDAFTKAHSSYLALYERLYFPKGRQLLSNNSDLYAWGLVYSIEEALVAIKTTPTVFSEALLDYSAIHNSTIDGRDKLLEELARAIKNIVCYRYSSRTFRMALC